MAKIIVVDDEPFQLIFMKKAIESLGHEVETAASGTEALQKASSVEFDILLTDMRMPDLSGPELIAKVLARKPGVFGVLVTAQQSVETVLEAVKQGAVDFVQKPVEFGMLDVVLKRVLRIQSLEAENRRLNEELEKLRSGGAGT